MYVSLAFYRISWEHIFRVRFCESLYLLYLNFEPSKADEVFLIPAEWQLDTRQKNEEKRKH